LHQVCTKTDFKAKRKPRKNDGLKASHLRKRKPSISDGFLDKCKVRFSAWRTEVRDERPSDRTAESHKAETLAAQGFAGLARRFNLKKRGQQAENVGICF
jgi:hypothetical protein